MGFLKAWVFGVPVCSHSLGMESKHSYPEKNHSHSHSHSATSIRVKEDRLPPFPFPLPFPPLRARQGRCFKINSSTKRTGPFQPASKIQNQTACHDLQPHLLPSEKRPVAGQRRISIPFNQCTHLENPARMADRVVLERLPKGARLIPGHRKRHRREWKEG